MGKPSLHGAFDGRAPAPPLELLPPEPPLDAELQRMFERSAITTPSCGPWPAAGIMSAASPSRTAEEIMWPIRDLQPVDLGNSFRWRCSVRDPTFAVRCRLGLTVAVRAPKRAR
jgi:hypothetical protein